MASGGFRGKTKGAFAPPPHHAPPKIKPWARHC